ncbi:Trypsin-like peptidase domain-containing protein [Roseateles sp. YR242]|uniref:S1 family peptidase n=1 Tax=Roseateles sp. YR242 TaxID=1855305 RepID=UPI0008CBAB77|nr:serine protease [Roseateles sp. YR242]SEK94974.1 Trypsin-like peptidase domain-containing protein [Roseateles sp. YR242]
MSVHPFVFGLRLLGRLSSGLLSAALLLTAGGVAAQRAPTPAPVPAPPLTAAPAAAASHPAQAHPAQVSVSARRLYERTRSQLLQVRTLVNGSQASVGSGFVVSAEGHVITNYHVVSQHALEPERYRLQFSTPDGESGELELLDVDVRRDLALLRLVGTSDLIRRMTAAPLVFRPVDQPLAKGERIYSMGNPHDVAFAVVEGTYNGLVERSFDPLIYYSGSINPGMSGGPVLDEEGEVVGVNVSTMFFSQQMSFLVPGGHAAGLLARSRSAAPLKGPAWPRLREQVMAFQDELVRNFLSQPWRSLNHPRYRLPIPQEQYMRCWGSATPADAQGLQMQRTQCRMEQALFVSEELQTGYLSVQEEAYDGSKLGALRFSRQFSASFRNERLGGADRDRTAPYCTEDFVQQKDGPPLRAVACMRAYRKLEGLYDVSVLVTNVDAATEGALGRFDARGVSFANATRLTRHYLQGFAWTTPR